MKNITVVLASNGKNRELAEKIQSHLKTEGVKHSLLNLLDYDLPLYTTAQENAGFPEDLERLNQALLAADAFIIVSPEYNGGVPPIITNALAWVSRASKDWRAAFNGKAAALFTHSGSGGLNVLAALRQQLSYVGLNIVGRQVVTTLSRPLVEDDLKATVAQLIKIH